MARAYDQEAVQPAGDVLHEACGVAGIYAPGEDVARLAYFGLYALQHRGQESAGPRGRRRRAHRQPSPDGPDHRLVRRGDLGPAARFRRDRAHALLHHRQLDHRQRAAVRRAVRSRRVRVRAQRQPHQRRRTGGSASRRRALGGDVGFRDPREDDRARARFDVDRQDQSRDARRRRRVLRRDAHARRGVRVPRSVGRAAVVRRDVRRPRVHDRVGVVRARHRRRALPARDRRGRSGAHRRERRSHRAHRGGEAARRCACSSTSTSRGPTAC